MMDVYIYRNLTSLFVALHRRGNKRSKFKIQQNIIYSTMYVFVPIGTFAPQRIILLYHSFYQSKTIRLVSDK